jgi:hypothetical protein
MDPEKARNAGRADPRLKTKEVFWKALRYAYGTERSEKGNMLNCGVMTGSDDPDPCVG